DCDEPDERCGSSVIAEFSQVDESKYKISALDRMTQLSSAIISPGITREEIENRFFASCALAERADEFCCIFERACGAERFCTSCFILQKFQNSVCHQRQG